MARLVFFMNFPEGRLVSRSWLFCSEMRND